MNIVQSGFNMIINNVTNEKYKNKLDYTLWKNNNNNTKTDKTVEDPVVKECKPVCKSSSCSQTKEDCCQKKKLVYNKTTDYTGYLRKLKASNSINYKSVNKKDSYNSYYDRVNRSTLTSKEIKCMCDTDKTLWNKHSPNDSK